MTTITDKNERAMREGMVAKTATPNLQEMIARDAVGEVCIPVDGVREAACHLLVFPCCYFSLRLHVI